MIAKRLTFACYACSSMHGISV